MECPIDMHPAALLEVYGTCGNSGAQTLSAFSEAVFLHSETTKTILGCIKNKKTHEKSQVSNFFFNSELKLQKH